MAQSCGLHVNPSAMAKKSDKQQASALDEIRRYVRVFVDLGRLAGESTDQDRFLDQVVVQVARAVEIDHVKVLRYRRRETDLLVAAGFGWKEGVVRSATLSADLRSPPGRSFQTAQPVVVKNFQAQEEFIHSGLLQQHGIVSLVNVPVLIAGAAWGVLEVDSTRSRDFSQDTIEFLTATAALIGACLQSHQGEPSEAARLATAAMEAQHRDVLLREMQHRVKNNFQIILASIAIQKRRYSVGDAHRAWTTSPAASTRFHSLTTNWRRARRGRSSSSPITCVRSVFRSNNKPRGSKSRCTPTNSNYRSIVPCRLVSS